MSGGGFWFVSDGFGSRVLRLEYRDRESEYKPLYRFCVCYLCTSASLQRLRILHSLQKMCGQESPT